MAASLSPLPKFGPLTQPPQTEQEWLTFFRWLLNLYTKAAGDASAQQAALNQIPPSPSHSLDAALTATAVGVPKAPTVWVDETPRFPVPQTKIASDNLTQFLAGSSKPAISTPDDGLLSVIAAKVPILYQQQAGNSVGSLNWMSFTPTIIPETGMTFAISTNFSQYAQLGTTVFVNYDVTGIIAGTVGIYFFFVPPLAPATGARFALAASYIDGNGSTYANGYCVVEPSSNIQLVKTAGGNFIAGSAAHFTITGLYETT